MLTREWNYSTSPIAWAFKGDRNLASFIIGPVGSGKSVPLLQRILDHGREQVAGPDGKRRTRFAVIRNTMPELRSTTAPTYDRIYPEEVFGPIIWRSPAEHVISPPGTGLEILVNLIALDKPKDVKKLLSMELTGAALNEVREIPRSIVSRLTERIGRYMIDDRPTSWSGIWADTNPPDSDHWLYDWHHVNRPKGYSFHQQPPGVLEVQPLHNGAEIIDENFPDYQGIKLTSAEVLAYWNDECQWIECPIEVIRAAERYWIVNPWLENMPAISKVHKNANPLGSSSYYGRSLAGKNLDEIRSYMQGVYTFVSDGRRVVPQYNPDMHARETLPVLEDHPILIGADIGGGTLQPSAILFQKHPKGTYLMHHEVVCYDMGIDRFGGLVKEALVKHFPSHVARGLVGTGWGDPAGEKRDEIFETKSFEYLRNKFGIDLRAAPSQDPKMRIAALSSPCERLVEGKPAFLVSRTGCPTLHKGLMGAWYFRRLQVSGEDRYSDTPAKTAESHICDGAGYGLLGAGEFVHLGGRSENRKPPVATSDFDPLDL